MATTPPSSSTTSDQVDPSSAPEKPPARSRWALSSIRDEIDPKHSDLPVLICCAVSGLSDSVAFNAASVFVSMQTGNTIFLCLGVAGLPATQTNLWLRALVSVVFFWAGCFCFGRIRHLTHATRPLTKLVLFISFLGQAIMLLISAALAQSNAVSAFGRTSLGSDAGYDINDDAAVGRDAREQMALQSSGMTLIVLALLAFGFGGQIVASRTLGINEVPTNVLTSLYCDLWSDPKLFAFPIGANLKRNRRTGGILLFFVGGIVGAWLQRSKAGMPAPLWISAFIKFCLAFGWLFWKSKKPAVATSAEKGKTGV